MRDSRAGGRGPAPLSTEFDAARAWAEHFTKHGRRVWCENCLEEHRVRTTSDQRLRALACTECGGRLRQARWFKGRMRP